MIFKRAIDPCKQDLERLEGHSQMIGNVSVNQQVKSIRAELHALSVNAIKMHDPCSFTKNVAQFGWLSFLFNKVHITVNSLALLEQLC